MGLLLLTGTAARDVGIETAAHRPPRTLGCWMLLLLIVSLVVIGGLMLLLGILALLVVCSGINDLLDDTAPPSVGGTLRSACRRQQSCRNLR
jgi:hypothetical protein